MKRLILKLSATFLILHLSVIIASAQKANLDSLYAIWEDASNSDSLRTWAYGQYVWYGFVHSDPDSAYKLEEVLISFGKEKNYPIAIAKAYNRRGIIHMNKREFEEAQEYYDQALEIFENEQFNIGKRQIWNNMSILFKNQGDYKSAYQFATKSLELSKELGDEKAMAKSLTTLGRTYEEELKFDSALVYYSQCLELRKRVDDQENMHTSLYDMGYANEKLGNFKEALDYYNQTMAIYQKQNQSEDIARMYTNIAYLHKSFGKKEETIDYHKKALAVRESIKENEGVAFVLNDIASSYKFFSDYPKALSYYLKSLEVYRTLGDTLNEASLLNQIASVYSYQGLLPMALKYYNQSLSIYREFNDLKGIADVTLNIGYIYSGNGEHDEALTYYLRAQEIYEKLDNQNKTNVWMSLGNVSSQKGDKEKALEYYNKALDFHIKKGDTKTSARVLNNIALVYRSKGRLDTAMTILFQSLRLKESINDTWGIGWAYGEIGATYRYKENYSKALEYCGKAFEIAYDIGALVQKRNHCECLFVTHKAMGDGDNALFYLEKLNALNDSLDDEETVKQLQQIEFTKQVYQDSVETYERERQIELAHEEEMRKEEQQRNVAIGTGFFVLLVAGGIYSRLRFVRKSKAIIEKEKDRSENLLLNILPAEVATELKEKGESEAKDFENVTVLFSDFKQFTQTAEKLSAKALVKEINTCFKAFDEIMQKYGIEKIKTIGDAYMAAGGLHVPRTSEPVDVVKAGLEMQQFMLSRKEEKEKAEEPFFEMRVGIHTGPVVAGIVGVKKFQYDIWGDTVNTASRMESHGVVGKVNLSSTIYELIKDQKEFEFEKRETIEVKGKGEMDMWLVSRSFSEE